ncbi:MAG: SDR family NAD(P)-dependent oxidoreductase [Geminicoccaceae bacterium]|nr:SDR family NAD(P)-dependent oxidoreductase [Geminicoccaceae bacterium]
MPSLNSFEPGLRAVVVGASGGIGRALTLALAADPAVDRVLALSRQAVGLDQAAVQSAGLDAADEASVERAAKVTRDRLGDIDLVLVAIGVLQDEARGIRPERTWRAIEPEPMLEVFQTNTVGPALIAKHFLPLLARDRKSVLAALSARVGSIADNRLGGWHSYRASKAALNMLIRCFAIELARRNPSALCVGLHPGTVDTALSAPFQANVTAGRLFEPATAAGHLLGVIDRLEPGDSGGVFAWDGERIPA